MQSVAPSSSPAAIGGIVPALRYRDVRAAVTWLCDAFGFEVNRLLEDADGSVRYAQLSFADSIVMLCPVGGSAFDTYMTQPGENGGRETQVCYVFVPDAKAHQERAAAAGAEIVLDIDGGDGKGRGYTCRDLEGHIWSFGTYDPWRLSIARTGEADAEEPAAPAAARFIPAGRLGVLVAGLIAGMVMSFGLVNWVHGAADPNIAATLASIDSMLEKPADLDAADRLLRQARGELVREREARMKAERRADEARSTSVREKDREVRTIATFTQSSAQLSTQAETTPVLDTGPRDGTPVRIAVANIGAHNAELEALKRAKERVEAELAQERRARETSTQSTQQIRDQLARERSAREAAEVRAQAAIRKAVRIEAAHRADWMRRNGYTAYSGNTGYYGFKDASQKVFGAH